MPLHSNLGNRARLWEAEVAVSQNRTTVLQSGEQQDSNSKKKLSLRMNFDIHSNQRVLEDPINENDFKIIYWARRSGPCL